MTTFTLVVFGDVTNNISHTLRKLLLSAQSGPRNNFLRNTESALRQQFHRLYPHERDSLPNFAGIHDLLKIYEDGKGACHPAISNVLLCITQLLQLLRYEFPFLDSSPDWALTYIDPSFQDTMKDSSISVEIMTTHWERIVQQVKGPDWA